LWHEAQKIRSSNLFDRRQCFRARAVLPFAVAGRTASSCALPPAPVGIKKAKDMAGYVKIWTTLANKPEFMSCTALYRGLYLQVLFWCKVLGDTGVLSGQSWAAVGSLLGCDGKTARKFLGKFQDFSFLRYKETEYGAIIIEVPKYKYWQELEVKALVEKIKEISGKIPPLTRPDLPDLPDQSILLFTEKFRELCPSLPKPKEITRPRCSSIRRRLVDLKKANITVKAYFEIIEASDFLTGRFDNSKWKATFDWILKPANFQKIIEGNYLNRQPGVSPESVFSKATLKTMQASEIFIKELHRQYGITERRTEIPGVNDKTGEHIQ
jgi:hypothetical protein